MSDDDKPKKKVVFAIPPYPLRPYQQTLDALRAEVSFVEAAGYEHQMVCEIGNPYISAARATMLRKALDAKATHVFFIDHDISWKPGDLTKVLETEGGLVAGTYRFKKDEEVYMGGILADAFGRPILRESDGALDADRAPAGFLKIERWAVSLLMEKFPELCYGERCAPHFDLFNHGAKDYVWWGEDYACCRRWVEIGQKFWIVPDIDVTHWDSEGKPYRGNFHKFLLRQPGGSESDKPVSPAELREQLLAKVRAAA
jgi:hypothetical protein